MISLAAIALAFRPWLLGRRTWIAVAVAGFVGEGVLLPVAVAEIDNPIAGTPDTREAADIVEQMAGNLHNALRLRAEQKQRSALLMNVHGSQLDDVLPELRRALVIRVQGGGLARVESIGDVVVKDIEPLDGGGFRALAEWSADARAGHWGHLHRRRMRLNALMELVPVEGAWMLAGLTVTSIQQER